MDDLKENIFVCGDTHGSFAALLKWNRLVENSTLIHVGDISFSEYDLWHCANKLATRQNKIYCVKGNHDYPLIFDGRTYGRNNNATLLDNYRVINVGGYNILNLNGGISLDRKYRIEFAKKYPHSNNYYHESEPFVYDEEKLKKFRGIDILITHTAPNYLVPNLKPGFVESFAKYDDKLLEDVEKERQDTAKTIEILVENNKFRWFFGHYHSHVKGEFKGIEYTCLDIDEIIQI